MRLYLKFLFAVFLLHIPQFPAQGRCDALEAQLDRALETDLPSYLKLTQDLKRCEAQEGRGEANSRYRYFLAKYFLMQGKLQNVKALIQSDLKIQKNQSTSADLKLLEAATLMLEKNYSSSIARLNDIISKNTLTSTQSAKVYQYLASCHQILGNRKYSFYANVKSCYYAKKTNDRSFISNSLANIAVEYLDRSDTNSWLKAVYYYKKALETNFKEDSAKSGLFLCGLGAAYNKLRNEKQATYYLSKAYNEYKHFFNESQLHDLVSNLGAVYLIKGDYDRSTRYYNEALTVYKCFANKSSSDILIYYNISELEYMKGNYRKSRDYLRTYFNLKRYYDAKERNDKVIEMQERFYLKDRQAQILSLKNRNQQAKLQNYFLQTVLLVSLFLFVIGIVTYSYFNRKRQLAEKLRVKNEIKRAEFEATENEKLRFSRDLHDSLGGNLTVVGLLISQAKERNPDQEKAFEDLYQLVQSSITDLRRVCRDLFPSEILVSGVTSAIGYLYERLTQLNTSVSFVYEADEIKLEKGFSVNLFRVVQELTNNSLKYASATEIKLSVRKQNDQLQIVYADNGVGTDLKELKKGVGLNSIEERTKAFKGSMKIASEMGNGFSVVLSFPVEGNLIKD